MIAVEFEAEIQTNLFIRYVYLNYIIKHGAFHQEGVVAPLDPGDAALVAGDKDRGVMALHELPHLRRTKQSLLENHPFNEMPVFLITL